MNDHTNEQEVAQLFADFAARGWEPPEDATLPPEESSLPSEKIPPEAPVTKHATPKKYPPKKKFLFWAAAAVCLVAVLTLVLYPRKAELTVQPVTLSAGISHIAAIQKDGTVLSTLSVSVSDNIITSNPSSIQDTRQWTDLVSISVGELHTLGLKQDGTVISTEIDYAADGVPSPLSSTTFGYMQHGQTEVSEWTDIVAVSAGLFHSVGLRKDGTVVAVGDNSNSQCEVGEWCDIIAIEAGNSYTLGLRSDGTVTTTAQDAQDAISSVTTWTDIVAISAGYGYALGLRDDGTVVAAGSGDASRCAVATWTDIVSIATGVEHSVGLRKDGTVVSTKLIYQSGDPHYYGDFGQTNVGFLRDIVAIDATQYHTVALTSEGRVLIAGLKSDAYAGIKYWYDIQVP